MELRHLRYFVAVAEEEHMTRAAARLAMQQPPLSQQIKALEEELGVTLFTRRAKGMQLNAAGKLFLGDARDILARVADATQRVQRFDLGEEGRVRVGFTSSASLHELTPRIVRAFRAAHPLVSLEIEEGATHDLLCALEQERIDVAFVRSPVTRYATLDSLVLLHEPLVAALPTQHRLAQEASTPLRLLDLKDEDFILYRQVTGAGIRESLVELCAQAGFVPRAVQEVYRIIAAIHLVAAGLGISIVPKSMQSIQAGCVVYRAFGTPEAYTVPLQLAYRRHGDAQAIRRFIALSEAYSKAAPG